MAIASQRCAFIVSHNKNRSMDKNTGVPWWAFFVVPIAALTTYKIFRNTARGANRTTEDMTDSTAQAAKFYGYFGVKITPLNGAVATPVVLDATKKQIGWLARNINVWRDIQSAFTAMCGGNYTIIQAASTALNTTDFNGFITLINEAQGRSRIFCGASDAATLYGADRYGGTAAENFSANAYVGRCVSEDSYYYYYYSWRDGVMYQAPKDRFILTA